MKTNNFYTIEIVAGDEDLDIEEVPKFNPEEEYQMNLTYSEVFLDIDEDNLNEFISYSLVFFMGWIISGVFG